MRTEIKVFFSIGVSLDGFVAGENRGPRNPLGDRGTTIHNWMYKQKAFLEPHQMSGGEEGPDNQLLIELTARPGAYIMGKSMFEEGEPVWPEDLYKAPVYVLTSEKRDPWIQKGSTTFYFINDGIHKALELAISNSNGKDIRIQGGANTIQQFLNAGLIDEFTIHYSSVLLRKGHPLFANITRETSIRQTKVIPSDDVTHISYEVVK